MHSHSFKSLASVSNQLEQNFNDTHTCSNFGSPRADGPVPLIAFCGLIIAGRRLITP